MIPVVLIHKGMSERYPLGLVVKQAEKWGNQVVLLDDEKLRDYNNLADEFAKHYEHLSGNHSDFELFCFQRWFMLYEWMEAENHDLVFYQDSDVLLFCNVREAWPSWGEDYALTLSMGTSPATSYFTLRGLRAFLDFVNGVYVNHDDNFVEFQRIYAEMVNQKLAGGICDMTLFKFFRAQVTHIKVGEMSHVKGFETFDHNINSSDGFEMQGGIKKIDILNNRPYPVLFGIYGKGLESKTVRFLALHFQGQAKNLIQEYVR